MDSSLGALDQVIITLVQNSKGLKINFLFASPQLETYFLSLFLHTPK